MRKILDSRLPTLLLGLLLGIVVVAGTAGAQDDGDIHACAINGNGQLRLVEDSADCRRNETSVTWSIQGPPGPSGVLGFYQVEGTTVVVSPRQFADSQAFCEPGDVVTGGGYDVGSNADANVWRSKPADSQSWVISLFNEGELGLRIGGEAWALCADITP